MAVDLAAASELDLETALMRHWRRYGELTRIAEAEIRHVCYYAHLRLKELREHVVRPGYEKRHALLELKEVIAQLEGLCRYLEGQGYAVSAMGDRSKR